MKTEDLAVMIKKQFDVMGMQLRNIDYGIEKLEVKNDNLENQLTQVRADLTKVKQDVEFIRENNVFKIEHEDLRSRVGKIESKLKLRLKV
ncbi:MAG: hypothetical protein WC764_00380 [Candidatus Paceibacterota bacterium]|jgi:regulator of replication initiation timing